MATRFVKGKARTETPRDKDLPVSLVQAAYESAGARSDGRDEQGRAVAGNRLSVGNGFKAQVRRSLGDPNDPAIGALVRQATHMYSAILRDMPSDGPQVRQLVAAQARHAVLATHYSNLAAKVNHNGTIEVRVGSTITVCNDRGDAMPLAYLVGAPGDGVSIEENELLFTEPGRRQFRSADGVNDLNVVACEQAAVDRITRLRHSNLYAETVRDETHHENQALDQLPILHQLAVHCPRFDGTAASLDGVRLQDYGVPHLLAL